MARDEHYRKSCVFPNEYDELINRIKLCNPYCNKIEDADAREEFASEAVNSCIRSVLYGNSGLFCCTGGAMAVKGSSNPNCGDFNKVILAYR